MEEVRFGGRDLQQDGQEFGIMTNNRIKKTITETTITEINTTITNLKTGINNKTE